MIKLAKLLVIVFIMLFSIYLKLNTFKFTKHEYDKTLNVTIKGEVIEEKTIEIVQGSTFEDIVKDIGYLDSSDLSVFGLEEPLYDGQIIEIKKKDDNNKISINISDANELSSIKGIGLKTANKIIEYRETYGNFKYLEELKLVSGIGEKKYEQIKEFICL